jgi:Cd2+/Zn2+-exporting ATPase
LVYRLGSYCLVYSSLCTSWLTSIKEAFESIGKGEVFSEFLLMSIATIGAFAIGEYPEGVAVMLFYAVGEVFQTLAVKRAKANIKTLLDQRPDEVTILENNQAKTIKAETVQILVILFN